MWLLTVELNYLINVAHYFKDQEQPLSFVGHLVVELFVNSDLRYSFSFNKLKLLNAKLFLSLMNNKSICFVYLTSILLHQHIDLLHE